MLQPLYKRLVDLQLVERKITQMTRVRIRHRPKTVDHQHENSKALHNFEWQYALLTIRQFMKPLAELDFFCLGSFLQNHPVPQARQINSLALRYIDLHSKMPTAPWSQYLQR